MCGIYLGTDATPGKVSCWGGSWSDMYGAGRNQYAVPSGMSYVSKVRSYGDNACSMFAAPTIPNNLWCWGSSFSNGAKTPANVKLNFTGMLDLDASLAHICALLSDGSVFCWGADCDAGSSLCKAAYSNANAVAIAVGDLHGCVLNKDGSIKCWGNDSASQVSGAPSGNFTSISSNGNGTCAVGTSGGVVCWGNVTKPPSDVSGVKEVSVSRDHACAMKTDTSGTCWDAHGKMFVSSFVQASGGSNSGGGGVSGGGKKSAASPLSFIGSALFATIFVYVLA
jgi:hypothetical protein